MLTTDPRSPMRVRHSEVVSARTVVPAALAIGFLTGLLGVGGGFLVIPALVILLRTPMTWAIGTSLRVIAINSAASLAARAGVAEFDWSVIAPFAVAAVLASLFGKRVAGRFSGDALTRTFAVLLIAVAGLVSTQSLLSM